MIKRFKPAIIIYSSIILQCQTYIFNIISYKFKEISTSKYSQ